MIYYYNSNICCSRHLCFVEKLKKGYLATCLYCNHQETAIDSEHLYRQLYGSSYIHQTQIKNQHNVDYSFNEVKSFVEQLVLQQPNLSNEDVINEFEIFLNTLDITNLMLIKKKHNKILSNVYYQQKIIALQEKISVLEEKRHCYQKCMVKCK